MSIRRQCYGATAIGLCRSDGSPFAPRDQYRRVTVIAKFPSLPLFVGSGMLSFNALAEIVT